MTRQTAGALQFYAIGLVAYSALKVLTPSFYAIGKRNTPMIVSFLAIGTNLFLNWFFTFRLGWGHRGLAFSTSIVAITNFLILYLMMRHYTGRLETGAMIETLVKLLVAGVVLAAICLLAQHYLFLSDGATTLRKAVALLLTIAVGGAAFFGTAYLLHVAELRDVVTLVRGRFSRMRS
jgi:putative peptidoglycan lipid II flippase